MVCGGYQLCGNEPQQLFEEAWWVGEFIMGAWVGEKLKMGALGNLLPALHLHLVVRYHTDPAWPGPIWSHSPAESYDPGLRDARLRLLCDGLGLSD